MGPVNGLKSFATLSADAVTSFLTSDGTAGPKGAMATIPPGPRPQCTDCALKVPAMTLFATSVKNGAQVKPSPVIHPLGASARASTDWKPMDIAPRASAVWMTVAGESTCIATTSHPWSRSALVAAASLALSDHPPVTTTMVWAFGLTDRAPSSKALTLPTAKPIGMPMTKPSLLLFVILPAATPMGYHAVWVLPK